MLGKVLPIMLCAGIAITACDGKLDSRNTTNEAKPPAAAGTQQGDGEFLALVQTLQNPQASSTVVAAALDRLETLMKQGLEPSEDAASRVADALRAVARRFQGGGETPQDDPKDPDLEGTIPSLADLLGEITTVIEKVVEKVVEAPLVGGMGCGVAVVNAPGDPEDPACGIARCVLRKCVPPKYKVVKCSDDDAWPFGKPGICSLGEQICGDVPTGVCLPVREPAGGDADADAGDIPADGPDWPPAGDDQKKADEDEAAQPIPIQNDVQQQPDSSPTDTATIMEP